MKEMELYEKIRYTREYRNKSREELADYLGLSMKTIARMEVGGLEIKPIILKEISKFLDVPWEFYMDTDVSTLEEYCKLKNAKLIAENMEKYGGYFKLVDIAKDEGVTEEEFRTFLLLRRKMKRQD